MASEPPAKSGPNEAEETAPIPTSAEARKAAEALSKLDEKEDESASKGADADALGKAMQNLSVSKDGPQTKKVKVEASDITLLMKELDLAKGKATDLLKAHDGDAVKAMIAFVQV